MRRADREKTAVLQMVRSSAMSDVESRAHTLITSGKAAINKED